MGKTTWRLAVEPPAGWPARPWDHRFVPAGDGLVRRVAVDRLGNRIVDAEGDEVMTGPGFDHEAVKAEPFEDSLGGAASADLPASAHSLLDRARRWSEAFGHPWIGDEHLGLAVLERGFFPHAIISGTQSEERTLESEGGAALGGTLEDLVDAVARFYDGPDWEARRVLVRERMAGDWVAPMAEGESPPRPNAALVALIDGASRRGGGVVTPATVVDEMLSMQEPVSLVTWLLEGYGSSATASGPVPPR